MADISAEIAAFQNAVYGEDVRSALVSLANKVNDESSAAATTVSGYDDSLSALADGIFEIGNAIDPSLGLDGYKITTGVSVQDSDKRTEVFAISDKPIYIKTQDGYQYRGTVSASTMISTSMGAFEGWVYPRSGANYVAISFDKTATTYGAFESEYAVDATNQMFDYLNNAVLSPGLQIRYSLQVNGYKITKNAVIADSSKKMLLFAITDKPIYINTQDGYQYRTATSSTTTIKTVLGAFSGFVYPYGNANYVAISFDTSATIYGAWYTEFNTDKLLAIPMGAADAKSTGDAIDALVLPDKQRSYNLYNLRDGYKTWTLISNTIVADSNTIAFVTPLPSGRNVFRFDGCSEILDLATIVMTRWTASLPTIGVKSTTQFSGTVYNDDSLYGVCNQNSNGYGIIFINFSNSTEYDVAVFARTLKKHLVFAPVESGYVLPYKDYYIPKYGESEITDEFESKLNQNKWFGKTIWWCGTSIPEGKDTAIGSEGNGVSYPELVGELLGATVINKSLGSSMARANVRTGNYVNALSHNIILALSQTIEEKQYMIDNWSAIRQVLYDPNGYESLSSITNRVLDASFESRLMPYLDGTYNMPDLFVFDHGHNDWKAFYTMPDGTTPDTELQPTIANISGNILAEDTYMTANGNAKLISFFGEINKIPVSKQASFIASINRNCFVGAINFLCTLILKYNPRARIIFIGNLDNWGKPQVQPAQEAIASSWEFPLVRMWEYTGFSGHYIPGTSQFWSEDGTTDLTMKQIYCKDGIHPHSDTTGMTIPMYAHIIANAFQNIN